METAYNALRPNFPNAEPEMAEILRLTRNYKRVSAIIPELAHGSRLAADRGELSASSGMHWLDSFKMSR